MIQKERSAPHGKRERKEKKKPCIPHGETEWLGRGIGAVLRGFVSFGLAYLVQDEVR